MHLLKRETYFFYDVQKLHDLGHPFVIVTVLRAEKPTSTKVGAKAIITEDRNLFGWIGGAVPNQRSSAKQKKLYGTVHHGGTTSCCDQTACHGRIAGQTAKVWGGASVSWVWM